MVKVILVLIKLKNMLYFIIVKSDKKTI